ncbi:MAG: peptidoglycan DD-metalloendopeptidase family protein [Gammaproteobacteria bacterium]|nr:peptidoglycan DD-metalloendopeptidase family protein [Pseudomonadales bacterium]
MVGLLGGCLGNYQAPISDQSETMDQSGPVIVVNSDDSPSRYGTASSNRNNSDSTASRSSTRATVSPATTSPARPAVAASGGRPAVHRVGPGESLYSIAFQYDMDVRSLAIANNLSPPYTIYTGQELSLDPDRPAPSQSGESTAAIGRAVTNNGVAQAQAASPAARGVIRQPISRSSSLPAEPDWQWPLQGQILTSFQADTSARKGIDIGTANGAAVKAAAAGEVVYAGNGIQGSGNLVILRHTERLLSAYAHNRSMLVTEGQRIRAGEQIGEAGVNGEGVALLHFEIRLDGKPVDPLTYLPPQ